MAKGDGDLIVNYNNGTEIVRGIVQDADGDKRAIWVPAGGGASQVVYGVPRRDPKDYGPEGGGKTWHPA
jgi:hypothetical protein